MIDPAVFFVDPFFLFSYIQSILNVSAFISGKRKLSRNGDYATRRHCLHCIKTMMPSLSHLNQLGGRRAMRKVTDVSYGVTLFFTFVAAFMLSVSGEYFTANALAQGQVQAVDSMQPDRETTEGVVIGAI